MAVERIVRIQRTWDIVVTAEYGDDDQALLNKASAGTIAEAAETKNLIPLEVA